MTIEFGIPIIDTENDYDELVVEIDGNPRWENDSFDYAGTHCTGGRSGTHHLPSYTILDEDVEWDKTKYGDATNLLIQKWVEKNQDFISDRFCHQLNVNSMQD
jgi:hypothetical protein